MEKEFWIVNSSNGLVYMDKNGKVWWGGSPSLVFVPLFDNRKEAQEFRKKAKKELKRFNVRWFQTIKAKRRK